MSRRVVITGIGVVAPGGLGTKEFWSLLTSGRTATRAISLFPRVPVPLPDRRGSRLRPAVPRLHRRGRRASRPRRPVRSGQRRGSGSGLRGPSGVLVTEQAGGLDAVAQARRQIRRGVRLLVTGGVDSSLCPWGWAAHLAGGELTEVADPARAYLPFSEAASGHVAGEGGALLVLEDAAVAEARGARVYGTVAGYAATFDPAPGSWWCRGCGPPPNRRCGEAGLAPAEVDVVFRRRGRTQGCRPGGGRGRGRHVRGVRGAGDGAEDHDGPAGGGRRRPWIWPQPCWRCATR